jgi:hypothetical protein
MVKHKILSVKVREEMDGNPITDDMGEYTDTPTEWAIIRKTGMYVHDMTEEDSLPQRSREYRFFVPYAGGEVQGTEEYRKYGLQDFNRMESLESGSWYFIGIKAKAKVQLRGDLVQTITSGGLWGIPSDSEKVYIEEEKENQLSELREELKAAGFSKKEIDRAFEGKEDIES